MSKILTWNQRLFLLFGFLCTAASVDVRPSEIVHLKTPNSRIKGKTYTFEDGREATAFLGIPYAQPPVGDLRFKRPKAVNHWFDVKETNKFGNRCWYTAAQDYGIKPSENCLFLNVFTPGSTFKKTADLRPIAFYIHGGSYQTDNAQLLGDENICRYLALKDVIVVTFNYRLQFFGFLTIDEDTPGNFALWDMAMALQFVKDNALSFGGDPNRITVFGQSAGSISTDLFTISPHTWDNFNQAIMFSGTQYVFESLVKQSEMREYSISFAETVGFESRPEWDDKELNKQLLKFYQNAPAKNITIGWLAMTDPKIRAKNQIFLTAPVLDGDFFPKTPMELRKEAPRKRTMTGVTEYEGLLFLMGKPQNISIYDFTREFMTGSSFKNPLMNSTIADKILHEFVDMSLPPDSLEFYKQCAKALSDFIFNYPTWKMVNTRVDLGETAYLYFFTYFKPGTLGDTKLLPFKASTHTLELPYVFGKSILVYGFKPNEEDKQKIHEFTTALTNFMKNGNPNDNWQPYNVKGQDYYWFNQNDTDGMQQDFCANRMMKWKELYEKYGLDS